MAKKKTTPAGTVTKTIKKVADAQKHIDSFFNALSGTEKFSLEAFTTAEGIQVTATVHE